MNLARSFLTVAMTLVVGMVVTVVMAVVMAVVLTVGFVGESIASESMTFSSESKAFDQKFEVAVRKMSQTHRSVISSQQNSRRFMPVTRAEMLSRAKRVLNLKYYYSIENSRSNQIENRCRLSRGEYWLRPRRLDRRINRQAKTVPYKWGGYFFEVEDYLEHLESGGLVGDVCVCRSEQHNYCLVPESMGLDCSGFISHVWKIPYHVTSTLDRVSKSIAWKDMKPGDAMNKAGSHVRLFVEFTDRTKRRVRVIESALKCEGVCENTYSISEMRREGYQAIRFEHVVD